ncbi:MAG: glycosyltransferase family 4 protein [Candidatus Krumholzibacteria bacterium]|nr:glycosyltransferase family 4 protein [Candidatus Krumholzibacteria bacterium]
MGNDLSLLILAKYGRSGPSSRYRILQYIPYLESHGFSCTVQSLHSKDYLETVFSGRGKSGLYYAGRLLARAQASARATHYSAVFVQKELAPYLPPCLELMLSMMRSKVVYDIDDAIFLQYGESRNFLVRLLLGRKIETAIRRSTVVLAGNSFLKEYAARYNRRTVYFPTVVDTSKYAAARAAREGGIPPVGRARSDGLASGKNGEIPVVGWIGSPETVRFLEEKADVLRAVSRISPFELRVIGAPSSAISGLEAKCVPWSEESEALELARCDVGIMPLPSSDWIKGKCGLKLLQYMASGLPVVSSSGGGADSIVEHGVNGFIAVSDDEWRLHLVSLLENPELRNLMGRQGLARVEERFSLAVWAPRMAEILTKCIRGEPVEEMEW